MLKCKIYLTSGMTLDIATNQFNSLDTFVGLLSQLEPGHFLTVNGVGSIAKDHIQFIEKVNE